MIKTPVNQVRLTNVAIVRLKKGGKKFELACYKNKIINWRNKQETDINEVLQIDKIFTNVSKGEIAKKKDLSVFGKLSEEEIIMEILNKGELQVSDLEREDQYDNLKKDIANIIAQKCINSVDQKQFPVSIILKAMQEVNFKLSQTKPAKKQALDLIKELKTVIPIERAKMRIKMSFSNLEQIEKMKEHITKEHEKDCEIERITESMMQLKIDPSMFRELNTFINKDKQVFNDVSIEIQDQQVVNKEEEGQEESKH